MLTAGMLERLRCPSCHSTLSPRFDDREAPSSSDGELVCRSCGASYPVHCGIADLVPRELTSGDDWELWRNHLEVFRARRELRIKKRTHLVSSLSKKGGSLQQAFAKFTGIVSGDVLDIGCGPGRFRLKLPDSVGYYGIDPIPLPEGSEFAFARALAEHIPFAAGTFSDLTVLAALDHFRHPEAFFAEASRVLQPQGRLHILQTLHESIGSPVRMLAHRVKDSLEDRSTKSAGLMEAPHHMREFDLASISLLTRDTFEIVAQEKHSNDWYSPRKLFLSLLPRR